MNRRNFLLDASCFLLLGLEICREYVYPGDKAADNRGPRSRGNSGPGNSSDGGGSSGPSDGGGGSSSGGGDDSGGGGDNGGDDHGPRSGLGDGTNPGRAPSHAGKKGKGGHGTNNPHN